MAMRMRALVFTLLTFAIAAAHAQPACAPGTPQLIVIHAGSLSAAFQAVEKAFTEQTGVCVVDIAGGSVSGARNITAGKQPCDIFASADFETIDRMLKPAGYADYTIRFAEGAMVLAYTTASRNAATIAATGRAFNPPDSVPDAAPDWHAQLAQPGVTISGSHPFLDPGGYRADLIFQLAAAKYATPNLYNTLLSRYSIGKPGDALGKNFDYQFTYEHSARAMAKADTTGAYRFARLPDDVSLGASSFNAAYAKAGIPIPGLQVPTSAQAVRIPASRVTWGLTVMKSAPNRDHAIAFLQFLFGAQGVAMQAAAGPAPIHPPVASAEDHARLPAALQKVVRVQTAAP
jgi:molybdate/tungstate transport system substrate-binding protein